MLLHLYSAYAIPNKGKHPVKLSDPERPLPPLPNGHVRSSAADRRAQDAQEFELEGLMSEDEDEPESAKPNGRPHGA